MVGFNFNGRKIAPAQLVRETARHKRAGRIETIWRALTLSPKSKIQRSNTCPQGPVPQTRHRFVPLVFLGSSPALFETAARLDSLSIETCFVLTPLPDGGDVRVPLRYRVADHVSVVRAEAREVTEGRVSCEVIANNREILHAWVVVADAPAGPRQVVVYAASGHSAFARLLVRDPLAGPRGPRSPPPLPLSIEAP